jgi:hypothetical protein
VGRGSLAGLVGRQPVFLGAGVRLFGGLARPAVSMSQAAVVEAPGITQLSYEISR